MAAVDWNDPCARFAALQSAYYAIVSGGGETLIRVKGPEGEQEVRYHAVDVETLRSEMASAQAACAAATQGIDPRRRFAIRGGAQRVRYPGSY